MAFADDLLEQAEFLANRDPLSPKQASLRRAVSTAYYALFHLLIDEAVGNWRVARQRGVLARTFDHGKMKSVCEALVTNFYKGGSPSAGVQLKTWPRRSVPCSNSAISPITTTVSSGSERML